jgi:hypothetical protein
MWWATLAAICFSLGAQVAPQLHRLRFLRRRQRNSASKGGTIRPTNSMLFILLVGQLVSLLVMLALAKSGRGLYESGLGAYLYELPVPMQAVQVIAVVAFTQQFLRNRTPFNLILLGGGTILLLVFTWAMRDVSNFRGFYLTGLVITGLAVVHLIKARVSYAWLIIPIIVVLPLFQYLGGQRGLANEELAEQEVLEEVFKDEGLLMAYWRFYEVRGGDMNIFDTFVAATQAEVKKRPYLMAWLYVPFHLVPRALWVGKPRKGIVQDVSFTRGAPLSPGIAGFFLLDGGKVWMLGSMLLLGYLICCLDYFVLTMRPGFARAVMMGVIVTNGMFLTRVFLWQYFYQALYMIIPLFLFMRFFRTRGTISQTVTQRGSREFLRQAR